MTVAREHYLLQPGAAFAYRAGVGFLLIMLAVAAVFAARFAVSAGLADSVEVAHIAANQRLWRTAEPVALTDHMQRLDDLAKAQRLAPSDAAPYELAARLHATPVMAGGQTATAPLMAREALLAALVRRPASGYAWAKLAAAEYALMPPGRLTDGFLQAHANAARFGPWEFEVLVTVVDLGLATWNETTAGGKAVTEGAITRLGLRNPDDVMNIAVRRGGLAQICDKPRWQAKPECGQFL